MLIAHKIALDLNTGALHEHEPVRVLHDPLVTMCTKCQPLLISHRVDEERFPVPTQVLDLRPQIVSYSP